MDEDRNEGASGLIQGDHRHDQRQPRAVAEEVDAVDEQHHSEVGNGNVHLGGRKPQPVTEKSADDGSEPPSTPGTTPRLAGRTPSATAHSPTAHPRPALSTARPLQLCRARRRDAQ
eukprot:scaffold7340_cov266-Pinguiococcus_pyrenoidosus.AAC.58